MKKISLALLSAIASFSSIAQVTLTGATNNPVAGDKFYMHFCDTTGVSKGAAGTAVTWDLSAIATNGIDSIQFLACSATPHCSVFPGAAVATTQDGGSTYDYFATDAARFAHVGSFDGSAGTFYSNQRNLTNYPMTYGATFAPDTFSYDSYGLAFSSGIDSSEVDGAGTLILPSGTFDSVLRVRVISHEIDSFDFSGAPEVDTYRYETFYWYRPGHRFILATMTYDTVGATGESYLSNVWYSRKPVVTPPPTLVNVTPGTGNDMSVYPNPTSDMLQVKLGVASAVRATVSITDMTGRSVGETIKRNMLPGLNTVNYSTASLPTGMYLLHVNAGTDNYVKKIVVQR